jgi:poly-gamma-glutamate synthesis protein (capsule biosynthesis protein)
MRIFSDFRIQKNKAATMQPSDSLRKAWLAAYWRNAFYCFMVLLVLILALLPLTGCNRQGDQAMATEQPLPVVNQAKDKPLPDVEFSILATGDIMMHDTQIQAGWQKANQLYDYAYMFEHIAPVLQKGDLVIGNLEVPLAGAKAKYSGYPMFNAPEILATNLKAAGFDVLNTANNHCLDKRYNGLVSTLDFLDEAQLLHTGTARSAEEQEGTLITHVKDIPIALIGATYGTNGMTIPQGKEYAVNLLDETLLLAQIDKARQKGAKYIIVMLHWGQEYQRKPNQEQINLAEALLAGGADLILGHHPHVLQRGEMIQELDSTTASGKAKNKFVMYSLGNFISSQKGLERLSSLILKVDIGIDQTSGEPYFKGAEYLPIYTQKRHRNGQSRFVVWPIEQALKEAGKENNPFVAEDVQALTEAWELILDSQPAMTPFLIERDPL